MPGEPLAPAQLSRLLARLKPIPSYPSDQQTFALRPGPSPPASAGRLVLAPFPPPAASPVPRPEPSPPGPLLVLRKSPTADGTPDQISVTFSQPMVDVSRQTAGVPLELTPLPPGQWRWTGTHTLQFQPQDRRFPRATRYQLQIPRGTLSAQGGALSNPVQWSFATPPPA